MVRWISPRASRVFANATLIGDESDLHDFMIPDAVRAESQNAESPTDPQP